jgi:hypothetical protein
MIDRLNGKPLINMDGERKTEVKNTKTLPLSFPLKSAIRTVPTRVVVMHVIANKTTFNQGNGRVDSSAKTSADRVNELSMKCFDERLQRLQVFTRLKSDSFSGRDVHLGTRSWISSDPGLARLHGKDPKATQFNPIVRFQGILHAIEDGVDRLFRFCLANARTLDDLIDEVEFDHLVPPS